jgi:hypothetical protein
MNLLNANYLSFFDKNDLTNGIDGSILCAMNANAISPKANPRLNPIKIVSWIIRLVILGILAFTIGYYFFCWFVLSAPYSWNQVKFTVPTEIVLWLWYWKLAKLFHYYERGLIFAAETIRCIKTLGYLCIINWAITYAFVGWVRLIPSRGVPMPLPQHVQGFIIQVVQPTEIKPFFNMGFFTFSIGGINFGLLLAGIAVVIIAWIMDEGRKIQEEQELTV